MKDAVMAVLVIIVLFMGQDVFTPEIPEAGRGGLWAEGRDHTKWCCFCRIPP